MIKIIFLDIDGPMISTPQLLNNHMASEYRSLMNQNSIIYINSICKLCDAKIVTNSSHNYHNVEGKMTLKDSLIFHGIKPEYIHDDWRTEYGDVGYFTKTRDGAILGWLFEHIDVKDYIMFDDIEFTDAKNLILVDFDDGIKYRDYEKALALFNYKKPSAVI
jgi:hypothetical protein